MQPLFCQSSSGSPETGLGLYVRLRPPALPHPRPRRASPTLREGGRVPSIGAAVEAGPTTLKQLGPLRRGSPCPAASKLTSPAGHPQQPVGGMRGREGRAHTGDLTTPPQPLVLQSEPGAEPGHFGVCVDSLTSDKASVPVVLEKLLEHVEMHGLYTEGLYRKSGAANRTRELRQALQTGGCPGGVGTRGLGHSPPACAHQPHPPPPRRPRGRQAGELPHPCHHRRAQAVASGAA